MDPTQASQRVKAVAEALGFDRCGIAAAHPIQRSPYVQKWLDSGRAGTMEYLRRNFTKRVDPRQWIGEAQSVIVVALNYHQPADQTPAETSPGQGRMAMYAWGADYHRVVKKKLFRLMRQLQSEWPAPFEYKVCVDTSPLLEREFAAAAGIGWIGKNTLVLHQNLGSYFFLGAVVTTLALTPDASSEDHCGSCTACLDACPTEAFPKPYEMDASRCISYLTIEHRGTIPAEFHEKIGHWVFGCDVCQQVCPYNRQAPAALEARFAIRDPAPSPKLEDILAWSPNDFQERLRGSAAKRATLDMWKRNARIARKNLDGPLSIVDREKPSHP